MQNQVPPKTSRVDADGRTYDDEGEYFFDCNSAVQSNRRRNQDKTKQTGLREATSLIWLGTGGHHTTDVPQDHKIRSDRLHYPFCKHFKTRFPAANIHRRNKPVATDTVFSDTPAIPGGHKCAHSSLESRPFVTDCYPMKTDAEFVNTLEDNIRERGAMDKLVSNRAQAETSNKVKDILRHYEIKDWQSLPHFKTSESC